ncbi:ABC-type transporter, integral membrane subunit [Rhizobium sp. CF080]|uniref:ABC transporter permease n=1 Tax=Rhizobium sp. (strain CF080) TaxID=1144310 RepID=UPI000271D6AE|nr:ABC transporter permease [Rhizobium sp. CF080]EUB99860.1 ABC-type transporter, integral membrane subunit [Rhizobium sp. CF080]
MTSHRLPSLAGALFVPLVAWICYLLLLIPTLIVFPISLGNSAEMEFPPSNPSLDLYRQFFSDPAWWGSMIQSGIIALITTVLTIVLAVPAAYALQRSHIRGQGFVQGLIMGPLLVPVIVLALGLYLQLGPWGGLNSNLTLVLSHTMLAVPFMMLSVGASLRHIDPALENAALIMGASKRAVFFRVVLPQLASGIAAGSMFAFLISLDEVIVAYFITGPDTQTLPVKMYSAIRWEVSPVIAAISTLLTIVSFVLAIAIMFLERNQRTNTG